MGFFGRLFGGKKQGNPAPASERRRWSFTRSSNTSSSRSSKRDAPTPARFDDVLDANKHAIAVAAATAAVAEAALAAAHAAAEVVRLTGGTRSGGGSSAPHVSARSRRRIQEYLAAVKIQSAFRGYLARRALRALKALVKLQALVRGHIVRKQTADMLRRMQTLVRVQAKARANRSHMSESFNSLSRFSHTTRCISNSNLREILDLDQSQAGSNRLDNWMEETTCNKQQRHRQLIDDEKSDKILEVDTWKPHFTTSRQSTGNYGFTSTFDSPRKSPRAPNHSISSKTDPVVFSRSADNSPQVHSSSSRPGNSSRKSPFTPTRSEYSWGYSGNYSGYYPNYMANTESYRAKVRSQSAPRQRLEFVDGCGSSKRSVQGYYYYAERSFDQRSDGGNRVYREGSNGLNRIPSAHLR